MRRSVVRWQGGGSGLTSAALAQFSVCKQPWNEYIRLLGKADDTPYEAVMNDKPMYRGNKRGFEEWHTKGAVQLHYRRYPDEQLFANLNRYRTGDTIGDLKIQQFRNAQPHIIGHPDEQGMNYPGGEEYLKLNYKNPLTIGRFLTRTGHYYPNDILPMHPRAFWLLRRARFDAMRLGLFPRFGNPFWFRSQEFRPKPHRGEFNPVKASTKETISQYCYNWLQTQRIKSYFEGMAKVQSDRQTAYHRMQTGFERDDPRFGLEGGRGRPSASDFNDETISFSGKTTTVPGLMSTAGLKKPMELYSKSSLRRMGFKNPLQTFNKL